MREEICENCGRIIGIAEQAFVCKGRIVCEQCDKKLRAPLEVRTEAAPARPRDSLLTGRQRPQETRERKELLEFQKAQDFKEFEELQEAQELQEPKEPQEPQAGPVEAEQAADVPDVPTPKSLSYKRKRVSTTESTLLPLSLAAWSFFALFLLFYVPGRYISMLEINPLGDEYQIVRFSVECLILFFMVLWFFGALGLYVIIVGYDKEEKDSEKLRILKLLGF